MSVKCELKLSVREKNEDDFLKYYCIHTYILKINSILHRIEIMNNFISL